MKAGGVPVAGDFRPFDGCIITGSASAVGAAVISGPATGTTVMTTVYSGLIAKGEGKLTSMMIRDQNPPCCLWNLPSGAITRALVEAGRRSRSAAVRDFTPLGLFVTGGKDDFYQKV